MAEKLAEQAKRWDANNRPIGFITGGVSGEPSVIKDWAHAGIEGKVTYGMRFGYDFLEVDLWSTAEAFLPGLKAWVEQVKDREKMEVGVHLSPFLDLTSALGPVYSQNREHLVVGTQCAAKVMGAKFALAHSCAAAMPEFGIAAARSPQSALVDPWHGGLAKFVESGGPPDDNLECPEDERRKKWNEEVKVKDGFIEFKEVKRTKLLDWFLCQFTREIVFAGAVPDAQVVMFMDDFETLEAAEKEIIKNLHKEEKTVDDNIELKRKDLEKRIRGLEKAAESLTGDAKERMKGARDSAQQDLNNFDHDRDHIRKSALENSKDWVKAAIMHNRLRDIEDHFLYFKTNGSDGEESMAYQVMAKWMRETRDPLWIEIVENSDEIKEYKKKDLIYKKLERDLADPDQIIYDVNDHGGKISPAIQKMVTAVAAKYLQGQLDMPIEPKNEIDMGVGGGEKNLSELKKGMFDDNGKAKSIMKYCKDTGMHFFIETTKSVGDGKEGKAKIMHATDHVKIIKCFAKHFGFDNVSYTLDFEHLTVNNISPERQIEALKEGDGKYISMIHMNPPAATDGLHKILSIYSRDIETVYRFVRALNGKGMKNAYFIWEIGQDNRLPFEAMTAFRSIKKALMTKDPKTGSAPIEPKNLPAWFFGMDQNFEARQKIAVVEHGFDPIKGLLTIPEEEHGAMSSVAVQKGKLSEWGREEYR